MFSVKGLKLEGVNDIRRLLHGISGVWIFFLFGIDRCHEGRRERCLTFGGRAATTSDEIMAVFVPTFSSLIRRLLARFLLQPQKFLPQVSNGNYIWTMGPGVVASRDALYRVWTVRDYEESMKAGGVALQEDIAICCVRFSRCDSGISIDLNDTLGAGLFLQ